MRSRSFTSLSLVLAFLMFSISSKAAVQDRISTISSSSRVALSHTVSPRALHAIDLGPVDANRKLEAVTFRFNMTSAQQSALTQLLFDQQNPSSPRYHQWLTPEQFGEQFGLSAADLAKVSAWITAQGMTITGTSRSRTFITVSATAGQVEQALRTSIHTMNLNGEQHISNVSDPSLPPSIAGVLSTVTGLNDFKLKPRSRVRSVKADVNPEFTSSISGNHYLAPGDFYTIYDVKPLLSSSINGNGVGANTGGGFSIAVVGQTDISLSDAAAFRAASGLSVNAPTVRVYGPDPGTVVSDVDEAQLDVEWAGAVAPSAKIVYVNSQFVLDQSLLNAVDSNLAPIVSISYGDCESDIGQSNLNSFNILLQQANAQGQTVIGPAGDSGATDCDYQTDSAVLGLAVDYPASSPYATGAGGTMFNEGTTTGATSYWSGTNASDSSSATGYIPEGVWDETSTSITGGGTLAAGGGGASAFFSKPYWQAGLGVPNDYARDTPDISLNAAANHDGYLFCSKGSCVTGFRGSDGQTLDVVGGTSVAAPSFAGILALVEQKIGSRIGNANPVLYALGNSTYSTNVFHDVVTGDNKSPCTAATVDCPTGGSIGYLAGPGYDLATGWGSVDAYNLATKWSLVTPQGPGGTTSGTRLSSTVVTTTGAVCGVSGGSITVSIAITAADSQTTPVDGGSVQLLIDGTPTGAPLPLSNGSASYTLNTANLSSGAHTLSAIYSGDASYAGSKGTLTTDVVSSTQPDFLLTPCTTASTVASGSTAAGITFSLTSVNGFAGAINLTATSDDPTLAASYVFSVTPVTLTSGGTSTTVFTLDAYQNNAKTGTGLLKITPQQQASNRTPWYITGSGATFACMILLVVPRRRRWAGLLAVICTAGMFAAAGCGAGSTLHRIQSGTTNAATGHYNVLISASSTTSAGTIVHSTNISLRVN